MTEHEVAWKLLELVLRSEPGTWDRAKILALYRECLAAVRGKAE